MCWCCFLQLRMFTHAKKNGPNLDFCGKSVLQRLLFKKEEGSQEFKARICQEGGLETRCPRHWWGLRPHRHVADGQ